MWTGSHRWSDLQRHVSVLCHIRADYIGMLALLPAAPPGAGRSVDSSPTRRVCSVYGPRSSDERVCVAEVSMCSNVGNVSVTVLYCKYIPRILSPQPKGHVLDACKCPACSSNNFLYVCSLDVGAVGARRWREHVRGIVVAQRRGARRVGRQGEGDGRVLVVRVEAQPLPAVARVVRESRADGVRRTGGTVAVVGARLQLIQGDGGDGGAVHGEGVARVAGKVGEGVGLHPGAPVHLGVIFLTAVILRRGGDKRESGSEPEELEPQCWR